MMRRRMLRLALVAMLLVGSGGVGLGFSAPVAAQTACSGGVGAARVSPAGVIERTFQGLATRGVICVVVVDSPNPERWVCPSFWHPPMSLEHWCFDYQPLLNDLNTLNPG